MINQKTTLGWDNSEDDCEIGVIKSVQIPDTANFTQRKYDYNKLEMQLLGWDNFNDQLCLIKEKILPFMECQHQYLRSLIMVLTFYKENI